MEERLSTNGSGKEGAVARTPRERTSVASTTPDRIDEGLGQDLLDRLIDRPAMQLLAPIIVIGLCVLLLSRNVSAAGLAIWTLAVAGATVLRFQVPRRIRKHRVPRHRALVEFRLGVLVSALAWTAGPAFVLRALPIERLAVVAMVFAGLVAAATATLVADRVSFHVFTVVLLVPLAAAFVALGPSYESVLMALLVILFGVVASALHRHAADQLTDLLRTSRRLEASDRQTAREKAFMDALFRSAPVAIVAVTEDRTVLTVNPAFEELFGYPAAEATGRTIDDLIVPPEMRTESRRIDQELDRTGIVTFETRRLRRDGKLVDVRIVGALASGEASGTGFVIYDDITARKRAETELREHEEQYRLLVQSMSDLVWQADLEGRWTFLNEASQDIYGLPASRMLGRSMADFCAPERRAPDSERFRRLLEGEIMFDCETVHIRADGSRVHLSFAGRPVRDEESRVIGARGTARDVTVRARINAELARARQEAEKAAAARSAFVANVSHEIRTPMNGIIGVTDLLLDSRLEPDQRRSLELIRTSADSLLTVINDILDYSKVEAGHLTADREAFDLHGLVDSVTRLLSSRASANGIDLRHEIDSTVPRRVIGDPGRVRQILNNLIGNALKFTERGEVVVSVGVDAIDGREHVISLAVRDTGIGIGRDKLDTIFEEFSQVDMTASRRFGGTGLGLAIARRLARLLGGDIRVTSEAGAGSTFVATIRVDREPDTTSGTAHSRDALAGRSILIIDAEPERRREMRAVLRAAGLNVASACDAPSGSELLQRSGDQGRPVDAVLIGGGPGGDGFALAGRLRTGRALNGSRLMLLTSGGSPGDGRRCREAGIDAYLAQPFSTAELLEALATLLTESPAGTSHLVTRHSIHEARRRISILVVEDNAINREVACTMLRRRGHEVDIATNGHEAVDAVGRREYGLVLMDLQMPLLDGLGATREIRSMPGRAATRIVALTAHALAEEKQKCLDAGMDGYLSKPFRPHELFAIVEGWGTPSGESATTNESASPIDIPAVRANLREAGIEDALPSLLDAFAADAAEQVDAIDAACASRSTVRILRATHALKSAAGTIGARPLEALLARLDAAARDGDLATALSLAPGVRPLVCSAIDVVTMLRSEVGA